METYTHGAPVSMILKSRYSSSVAKSLDLSLRVVDSIVCLTFMTRSAQALSVEVSPSIIFAWICLRPSFTAAFDKIEMNISL